MSQPVLVVDLDGTLIHTDMLHESALKLLRDRPLQTLQIPSWLSRGKAVLKEELASRVKVDVGTLPYNHELIDWLKSQRENGRSLVLCTASDQSIAQAVAAHLGIFDEVIASDGSNNLAGTKKAEALIARYGDKGFDYAGNSGADLDVWKHARQAIVVNASAELEQRARGLCAVEHVFPPRPVGFSGWRRVLRVHQWLKNLLLVVPLVAAHDITNTHALGTLVLAFLSFSLCASSVYIANDLLDLESDRQHLRKRKRPFASGLVPAWKGVILGPILLLISLLLGAFVNTAFLSWLLLYFSLTCVYSWRLKRLMLIDCLTLAMLYTLRIVAGAAAIGVPLSFWLLAFSIFLFLSLAFVKRYAELRAHQKRSKLHGRGYHSDDAPIIQMMGIVAGYAAVLVLALYVNSDAIIALYEHPKLIWGAVPVVLFWVSWVWMRAHRGEMHDDPLIFAIKDRTSLAAGAAFALVLAVGAGHIAPGLW
ncbi:MAG: UbiA family prenyltransferase [Lautropia sp.]|nr:UbiA family prenyltransferase [Lautropia sp.]